MTIRPQKHLFLPLLALSMTLAMVAMVHAQGSRTSATLQIRFGSTPHWTGVSGTRVEELPVSERRNYDMFRYDGNYYAYNNNQWYTSRSGDGDYTAMDYRNVPTELSRVPRDHWRSYPSWQDTRYQQQQSPGMNAMLSFHFGNTPHWTSISGTRVEELPVSERPSYDMFRYDGTYYAYNNNQWYTSRSGDGDYSPVDYRTVPTELSRVPRDHWRNYPTDWQDANYRGTNYAPATLQVNFNRRPQWAGIYGTRVMELRGQRLDYDMFRYGNDYYVFSNGRWYTSNRWRGEFAVIDDRSVPGEFYRIPRDHWRNYPAGWADRSTQRYRRHGQRY